ncbi:hypothetical protein D1007_49760 [Hordeum vulgare]|nr:hypothetical protein D1007_49760 [Hordeum vulgare]
MPQKGGKCGGSRGPTVPAAPWPALERLAVVNLEGLKNVLLVVATESNERGATRIWPGSWPQMISYYQIQALHLDPRSLVLLSAFAFMCEAFVGVTPCMGLLRHFFSLELISEVQCSGCASLRIVNASAPGIPCAELLPKVEGFRRMWVQVEAAGAGALFQPPPSAATLNWWWEHEELSDPRLAPVLIQLGKLRHAGVSMAMVVREFICRWIAPLKRHSRPMWGYTGPSNSMRTQVIPFSIDFLRELLCRMTGGNPDELPANGLPLYCFKAPKALTAEMPLFDEWGLLSGGKASPRDRVPEGSAPRRP